jgi:hypothetical protein
MAEDMIPTWEVTKSCLSRLSLSARILWVRLLVYSRTELVPFLAPGLRILWLLCLVLRHKQPFFVESGSSPDADVLAARGAVVSFSSR